MRIRTIVICALLLMGTSGCSLHDALFSAFGKHYSGGGTTRTEKRAHYENEVDSWNDYYNP